MSTNPQLWRKDYTDALKMQVDNKMGWGNTRWTTLKENNMKGYIERQMDREIEVDK